MSTLTGNATNVDATHAVVSLPTQTLNDLQGAPPQGTCSVGAWFLGPKAENDTLLLRLVQTAMQAHIDDRKATYPSDPIWIDDAVKATADYRGAIAELDEHHQWLLERMSKSVPFFSYRYQAHMLYDVTLPAVVGYVSSILYNQNNVAGEASPVTTLLEMVVGDELCEMLGFEVLPPGGFQDVAEGAETPAMGNSTATRPWGHITCDGSVANIESVWAARNLKFFALGFAQALGKAPALAAAKDMAVALPDGSRKTLVSLSAWETANLAPDDILALPQRLEDEHGIPIASVSSLLNDYSVQGLGLLAASEPLTREGVKAPVVIVPATAHYSWSKSMAILGLGQGNLRQVPVDQDARMDLGGLRAVLEECLASKTPVLSVVAVVGSTEESAVDPLVGILNLRQEFQLRGLSFLVHADAAWGGYFNAIRLPCATRREPCKDVGSRTPAQIMPPGSGKDTRHFSPSMVMSSYVDAQYEALGGVDSVTVDPHKAGMVPYPAGALCYRNSAMRGLVSLQAPVVYHGGIDPTVGVYGVEGSKPGAAAAAVWLSHAVIRPDQTGYGRILGRCLYGSKRLYASLLTMAEPDDEFVVVPLQRLPSERKGLSPAQVAAEFETIRNDIANRDNDELLADEHAMSLFRELGSDQIILSYAFNFYTSPGVLNGDAKLANQLNDAIFDKLSVGPTRNDALDTPMFVTSSEFDPAVYGPAFMREYRRRMGLRGDDETPITFLISTTLDPFITDTVAGNFIPILIGKMREIVRDAVRSVRG